MARHGAERALHSLPIMSSLTNGTAGSSASTTPRTNSPVSPTDSISSRIPRPSPSPTALRRSASLRLRGERLEYHRDLFPIINENGTDTPKRSNSSLSLTPLRGRTTKQRTGTSPGSNLSHASPGVCSEDCSDAESVKSYGSNYSTASACDHASFALNGTTWSGRSKRCVVHCSSHTTDSEQYLTPTQRAARQVRKFQALLREARQEIEDKDRELFRLTKEVVELRLYKASLNSPDEKTDSSETATVRENNPFSPESPSKELPTDTVSVTIPQIPEIHEKKESSLVDSGHFEDGSVHSKESVCLIITTEAPDTPVAATTPQHEESINFNISETSIRDTSRFDSSFHDEERKRLVDHYENRIEEMHRRHVDEIQLLKENQNDKVEGLLNQLAEVNTRYCEIRPSFDKAQSRAKELEAEVEALRTELAEQKALLADQEERNKQMYLKMYSKGQEAARMEHSDQIVEQAQKNPSKVSVAELLQQLTVTQAELENIKPFQDSSYSPEPLALASRSQSLLSLQEAVSLWVLGTRKVMYRRIVESRSNQGTLDPEITLQFLKSAIYYFLTDKENLHGHLNAIESILGFTDSEKLNIDRIYRSARK